MDFSILDALIVSLPGREQGGGATSKEIIAAEQRLGANLIGGYRTFLQRFGWLSIGSIDIYGVGAGVPKHLDLVDITLSERSEMHPQLRSYLIPVMNDGGGNLYCVDMSKEARPPLVFWDHELDARQRPEEVAASFEEWLHEKLSNIA